MRYRVLNSLYSSGLRTTALLVATGLLAGCSADAMRLNDGFYTGAAPQATSTQMAAANPGYGANVDTTMTGSIGQSGAQTSGGLYGSQQPMPPQQPQYGSAAPSASVQRGQLPPPPAPNYQRAQPSNVFGAASTQNQQTASPAPTRGAPPTSLDSQAQQIASPARRPSSSSTASGSTVTVSSGDTLSRIANRSGVSASAIREANNMSGDTVRLGQKLIIPTSRPGSTSSGQQVAAVQTAPTPSRSSTPSEKSARVETPSVSKPEAAKPEPKREEKRVAATTPSSSVERESGNGSEAAPQSSGISSYRWPVQGRVLQRFGEKVGSKRNDGLNISVPRGTPVKAAENGVVIYAGDGLKEFGNTVLVKHDDGLVTVYGHADALKVKRGDTVKRGQQIASSGMSGDTEVPQLHFEVRKNSAPIDPSSYLK